MCKSELESRARVCRCLEVRCVQVYLVSKCHVCSALVSVYKSQVLVLVRCCNSKSQVFNKSSLFNLLFNNLVLEFLLTQHILPWNPHFSSVLAPLASLPIRISSPLSATRLTNPNFSSNHSSLSLPNSSYQRQLRHAFSPVVCAANRFPTPSTNDEGDSKIVRGTVGASLGLACVVGSSVAVV